MTTKRIPFQASTLCAGGTLLVLGSFLALNLAGCGGGGGGLVTPTPSTTATAIPGSLTINLQLNDGTTATGGNVTLTSDSGRTYTGSASNQGVVNLRNVPPGLYDLVFAVRQPNGQLATTTRSITVTSGTQAVTLTQGSVGDSKPYTITGKIYLNPAGVNDPDGNSATDNCAATNVPLTDAVTVRVLDLNSTNGTQVIASYVRAAQATGTAGATLGTYSIAIPYRPTSLQVTVTNANDAPFAGLSRKTSFPRNSGTTLASIDVCTNASNTAPQPTTTPVPTATPFATATTVGTPAATATSTPVANPTATGTTAPTPTPVPTATVVPTNTPLPGANPTATSTPNGSPTNTPTP